nr:hypothetical protein [Candidatus Mycoplasma haematolamae]
MHIGYKVLFGFLGTGGLGGAGCGTYETVNYFLKEDCCECECTEAQECPDGCQC